ncbi:MAG: winged helix-turn-helix domain-containing protein [Lysobacter sp.]
MPRSPEPSPLPSDRLRVGECIVEIALREVHAPGARRARRITPKAMGVLLALVDAAGRVVSRDALLAQVWPDTLPSDDVITQAITQLRKAFGEERGNPRYIETIAKSGYRLLASIEWLGNGMAAATQTTSAPADPVVTAFESESPSGGHGAVPPTTSSPAVRRHARWVALAWALALAMVVVSALLLWATRRDAPTPAAVDDSLSTAPRLRPYRLITSMPGSENAPSLSPDAALVAYVARPSGQREAAVMVQTTDPSAPRQLSHPPAGADDARPAWSPDGREIAFLRVRPGRDCAVMRMPANGGTERSVGRCDHRSPPSFDWTHDGSGLVFDSRGTFGDNAGLRVLDLASGAWRKLDYAAAVDDIDSRPRYSPDGRWIVFVRNAPIGDFWRLPANGGNAIRLTDLRADIGGWDWTPDGRGIIYAGWSDSETRLYRLDLDIGLSRDLGIDDGAQPTLAANMPALAFSQQRNYFGIYRFGLGADGKGERLFPSSGRDRLPAIAPDGRQLVFASDRSGQFGLWWADLQKPESLRLIDGVLPESRHLPEWSPDSRKLLVVGRDDSDTLGIHEVVPASGRVSRLAIPTGDPVQALYLPGTEPSDAKRLLVIAGASRGRLRLTLYDRSQRPWRALASIDDVSLVRVDSAQRRLLLTRSGRAGLWEADLALTPGSLREIDANLPIAVRYRQWTVAGDGNLYFVDRAPDCAALLRRSGDDASPRCLDRDRVPAINGFSVSARANAAFVSLSEWLGGDIGFMTLQTVPEEHWPGTIK